MYKDYLWEREGAQVVEVDGGFAVFKDLGSGVYLQDIYVEPSQRQSGLGRQLLEAVETETRRRGYTTLLGSCDVSANGATVSAKAILATGFQISSVQGNMIYFKKDL